MLEDSTGLVGCGKNNLVRTVVLMNAPPAPPLNPISAPLPPYDSRPPHPPHPPHPPIRTSPLLL